MALELKETFEVSAPITEVWRFMMTPESVVACVPGASLVEVIDARTFVGKVKLKVGAITANYQGTISFTEIDEAGRRIVMLAEGKERGGGTVAATIQSSMRELAGGRTEVQGEASVELTGRIMQVGGGMILGISRQLFREFVAKTQARLEAPDSDRSAAAAAPRATSTPGAEAASTFAETAAPTRVPPKSEDDSIAVVPLLLRALWTWLRGLLGAR